MIGSAGSEEKVPATESRPFHILSEPIRGMARLGLDWRHLLRAAAIDPEGIHDPSATVKESAVRRLFALLPELTGDPGIGLHIADRVDPRASDIVDYLLLSSPTIRKGIERVVRFQRLAWFSEWVWLEDRGDHAFLHIGQGPPQIALDEFFALVSLRYLDWITEVHFKPTEARFRHAPAVEVSAYERLFHAATKFDARETGLVLPWALLEQPSMHASEEVARIHEEYAELLLQGLGDESVARKVKLALEARLEGGPPKLTSVAQALHMSPRTLQRRLALEGTTYAEVLNSLRKELALHWLTQGYSIQEVSYITGFSDESAFSRAVRRWTGQTPGAHRSGRQPTSAQ